MIRKLLLRVGTVACLVAAPLAAALAGEITISQPWARATPAPGGAGAAFMTITNAGENADKLVKAASSAANVTELHTHIHDGGIMRMEAVPSIDVPAKGSVALAPGGLHIMLIGLKEPLQEGATFSLTLSFENAGDIMVTVPVLAAGAMGAAASMPGGAMMPGGTMPGGTMPQGHPMHQGQ